MISIIIPIHNQADKIGRTLESILAQSETDWELIIVNDGSTDDIEELIKHYRPRFEAGKLHFFSKPNEGANPTRNFGFEHSSGELVIFCDADVIMKTDMLQKMKQALHENPEAGFAYSSFNYGRKQFRLFPYSAERLRRMPYIHATSLIRRSDFPGFDPTLKRFMDWDIWLTMMKEGKYGVWIDEVLFTTQLGGGHFSQWLPKVAYRFLPFLPAVKRYNESMAIIKHKHGLAD